MIEVMAFAFIASVAFVVIGKVSMSDHHPKFWKHIHNSNRVYYLRSGHHA